MFMAHSLYDTVSIAIYESEFSKNNALTYDVKMSDLKKTILTEMDKRGWNPTELARASKVPQPTIQRFLKGGHNEPRTPTLIKIAAAFGMTELQLRGGYIDGEVIHRERPKIESNAVYLGGFDVWDSDTPLEDDEVALPFFREVKLSAGNGRSTEVIENHGFKLRFAKSTLRKASVQQEHAYCVTVAGGSMEPVLPDGCTIGVNTIDTAIQDGKAYALDHNGELRVKLLYKLPGGGIRIRSYNREEYPDENYASTELDSIKILGRMFWYSVLL